MLLLITMSELLARFAPEVGSGFGEWVVPGGVDAQ